MNVTTAMEIVIAAKSGYLVAANVSMALPLEGDNVSFSWGSAAIGSGAAALTAIAAMLNQDIELPDEGNVIGVGSGEIHLFSEPKGSLAIPGYFDIRYDLPIALKTDKEE